MVKSRLSMSAIRFELSGPCCTNRSIPNCLNGTSSLLGSVLIIWIRDSSPLVVTVLVAVLMFS